MTEVPDFYETARTGIHYLLPVSVLIWCLMVEEMSPGLAAFWGVVAMAGVVLTQKPLTAFFRRQGDLARALARGVAGISSAAWSSAPATWRPSASPRPRPASWSAPSR